MSNSLLQPAPLTSTKWQPSSQLPQVLAEDSSPEAEESSFISSCDSVNDEDVCINSIATMIQESTKIQRTLFIQKNLRSHNAVLTLYNVLQRNALRKALHFYRNDKLKKINSKIAGRRINKAARRYLNRKREVNERLLVLFREHCAVFIQKFVRGFIERRRWQRRVCGERRRKERLKALVVGWKVRKVMRHPDMELLKKRLQADRSNTLLQEFIARFNLLYMGKWACKQVAVPLHRRILYKNNTMKLRIMKEKKGSFIADDTGQKESESHKRVKFALQHSESPKHYEPSLDANPLKSILKFNGPPIQVDWDSLQEKLDKLFEESEANN